MSDTKHTPGPWHLSDLGRHHNRRLVYGADGVLVADAGGIHKRSNDEMHANARLIAASPALYEALRAIEHQAIAGEGTLDENGTAIGADDFASILNTARAALRLAEGGEA